MQSDLETGSVQRKSSYSGVIRMGANAMWSRFLWGEIQIHRQTHAEKRWCEMRGEGSHLQTKEESWVRLSLRLRRLSWSPSDSEDYLEKTQLLSWSGTSDLQNCEKTDYCSRQPPSLGFFVTETLNKQIHTSLEVKWREVAQLCLTLCDLMDCSLPGSSVHGIFQVRILEWVVISFSRGTSWPRDQTQVSHIVGRRFTIWATRETHIQALPGSNTFTKQALPGSNTFTNQELEWVGQSWCVCTEGRETELLNHTHMSKSHSCVFPLMPGSQEGTTSNGDRARIE